MADDDSIGTAGTTPVEPGNPLYDAVKSGGGYVEDEDGNVSGGPDGDGTARTEEERTSDQSRSDPDTGDTTTTKLRDDAESDPMNRQTEEVDVGDNSGGSSEPQTAKGRYGNLNDDSVQNTGPSGAAGSSDDADGDSSSPPPGTSGGGPGAGKAVDDSSGSSGSGSSTSSNEVTLENEEGLRALYGDDYVEQKKAEKRSEMDSGSLGGSSSGGGSPSVPSDGASDQTETDMEEIREIARDRAGGPTTLYREDVKRLEAIKNVSDDVNDQTRANLERGEDFTVTVEDGRATAELTEQGRREEAATQREFARLEAESEVVTDIVTSTEADLERGEDFTVTVDDDGATAQLTDEGLVEETAARNEDVSSEDLFVTEDGQVRRKKQMADQGFFDPDARSAASGEQGSSLDTNSSRRRTTSDTNDGDIFSGAVSTFEENTGADVPGEGSLVKQGAQNRQSSSGEQFGDISLRIPEGSGEVARSVLAPTGPVGQTLGASLIEANEGRRSEDVLGETSDVFQSEVVDPASQQAGEFAASEQGDALTEVAGSPAGQAALAPLGPVGTSFAAVQQSTDAAEPTSQQREALAEGSVQGAGDVADVAGTGRLAKEGIELGVEGASQAAQGRGGEFASDTAAAGTLTAAGTARFARDNPTQFAGQLVGGAVVGSSAETAVRSGLLGRSSTRPDIDTDPQTTSATSRTTRSRTPNVEATVGRGAAREGRLEVNVRSDLTRRIDEEIERVRSLPDAARQRTVETAVDVQNLRQDIGIRARQQASLTGAELEQTVLRGAVRARNAANDLPDTVDRAARRGGVRAMNARQDLGTRARQQATLTAAEAEQGLLSGAVSARNTGADLPGAARQRAAETAVRAQNLRQDIGTRARQQASVTGAEVEQTLLGGAVSARNTAADLPGAAQQRAAEAAVDAQNLRQDLGVQVRQQASVTAAEGEQSVLGSLVGARNLRQDLSQPIVRERGAFGRDDSTRSGLGLMDLAQPGLDAASRTRGLLSEAADDLRETSLRVDVGRPTDRTVDVDDLDIDGDVGVTFDGDLNDAGGDASPGQVEVFRADDVDEVGDGTLAVRQSDTDSQGTGQSDLAPSRRNDGRGVTGLAGAAGGTASGIGGDAGVGGFGDTIDRSGGADALGVDDGLGSGIGGELSGGLDTGFDQGFGEDLGTDVGPESNTGFDTVSRTDTDLDQRTTQVEGQRLRIEQARVGSNSRRPRRDLLDLSIGEGPVGASEDTADGFARREERSLLNPFTGE